ncbi:MAG: 5'/3'-nucleotidase SurE [Ectothiorhodospiraceae bacterium]|nr:5'/3'-nucleotidase SurE [Ectothiorhodospiraceae bacterium]
MKRPFILVSNDDGFDAPGIIALSAALREFADVEIAAPATQQSAVGHAITVQMPLRQRRFDLGNGHTGWAVEGTPADSVKLAVTTILDRKPDLVMSGINHGMNTSINVIYSGTVSAATEGAILGLPSVAISQASHAQDADMRASAAFAQKIAKEVLERGLPTGTLLNVNVPNLPPEQIDGVALTKQGESWWDDGFERREDPAGRAYYWLRGKYVWDDNPVADDVALRQKKISVTPLHYKLTDHALFDEMTAWDILSLHDISDN